MIMETFSVNFQNQIVLKFAGKYGCLYTFETLTTQLTNKSRINAFSRRFISKLKIPATIIPR